jgi:hypothetical protein
VPGWVSSLLANQAITALLGVVLGAVLGFLGSLALSWRQARNDHRVAVRAILIELTGNFAAVEEARKGGLAAKEAVLDTSAYDALLVPLYSRLPADVAVSVGVAYSRLHTFKNKAIIVATENPDKIRPALLALWNYATKRLKLDLLPPLPGSANPPT